MAEVVVSVLSVKRGACAVPGPPNSRRSWLTLLAAKVSQCFMATWMPALYAPRVPVGLVINFILG